MQNNEFYLTPDTMKNMDPEELNADLIEEYVHEIPVSIETIEDMTKAGRLMGILTNNYAYLLAALNPFKIWVKAAKASEDKKEYEKMVMRRDSVEAIVDILKQQYNALSRLITIKQEINNELKMTDGK